ncbi:TPA: BglG family transcription antiterminator LicT [Proteus mirabilis]
MNMKIKKILNNSVVISLDEAEKEIIVMGKGIAYAKKVGDEITSEQITKKFILSPKNCPQRVLDLLSNITLDYVEIADNIIQYAKEKMTLDTQDSIYIALIDHIQASIERYKEGTFIRNKILWEIKNFYSEEFDIGLYGLKLINDRFNISMPEDEAGFIALHIASIRTNDNIQQTYKVTHFIQSITNIVKYYLNIEYDIGSLNYRRFVTHLRYFSIRLFSQPENDHEPLENELLDIIKDKYHQPYMCCLKISKFIKDKYNCTLDNNEILYLIIHIAKIAEDNKKMNK